VFIKATEMTVNSRKSIPTNDTIVSYYCQSAPELNSIKQVLLFSLQDQFKGNIREFD